MNTNDQVKHPHGLAHATINTQHELACSNAGRDMVDDILRIHRRILPSEVIHRGRRVKTLDVRQRSTGEKWDNAMQLHRQLLDRHTGEKKGLYDGNINRRVIVKVLVLIEQKLRFKKRLRPCLKVDVRKLCKTVFAMLNMRTDARPVTCHDGFATQSAKQNSGAFAK
eukprot:PhM_4_TR15658/c0_g1_i3/m.61370